MTNTFSGQDVANYIMELTADEDMLVHAWLTEYVLPNQWEVKTIALAEVLKDPAFKEHWENIKSEEDMRYNEELEGMTFEDYVQPVVLYQDRQETLLIDGYSRASRHLWNGQDEIRAYINKGAK